MASCAPGAIMQKVSPRKAYEENFPSERVRTSEPRGVCRDTSGCASRHATVEMRSLHSSGRQADHGVDSDRPRFAIAGVEVVVVAAIAGALFGLLFPAVEAARDVNGSGPLLPDLMPLHQRTFPLPIFVCSGAMALLSYLSFALVRRVAPPRVLRHLPWW